MIVTSDQQSLRSAFVGRQHELNVLRSALRDRVAGNGRIVLVSGEPGVGKTRLLEEFATEAREGGAQVVWGRCHEGEGAPALWPWIQILRGCTAALDTGGLHGLLGTGADDEKLRQLLPGWLRSSDHPAAAAVFESPQARFELFDAVTRLLAALAERSPLVLLLEDIHEADATSLQLLQFVAREAREARLLVIGSYQHGAAEDHSNLGETIVELLRVPATERLALSGFGAVHIADYIERQTGVVPAASLVDALLQRTDGNPLFIAEYVRLLRDEGRLHADDQVAGPVAVPERLRSVIVRRLTPLSRACREMLMVAAAFGREFPMALVGRVLESAAGEASQTTAPEAFAEARRAGVLVAVPDARSRARFSHALMRDVLYDDVPEPRRKEIHRTVAEALEKLADRDEHLAELAFHFARAGGDAARVKALHYAQAAAAQAAARTAYEEAIGLYQKALRLDERFVPVDEHRHCELLLALAEVRLAAGSREEARVAFQRAAESARRSAADGHVEAAQYLARAAIGHAGGWAGVGDVGQFQAERAAVFDAETVNLLEEALAALGDRDSALRACVLSQLAVQRHFIAPRSDLVALSQQAVELARRVGDPATLGYVRCVDWVVGWTPDNTDERLAAADEIIRCAEQARDRGLAVGGHFQRIGALLEIGAAEELRRESVLVTRLSAALRQPQWLWRARAHDITVALLEGRFDAARELLRAIRSDRSYEDSTTQLFLALQITALQRELGQRERLQGSATFLKAVVDQYPSVPSLRTRLAYLCAELGRLDEASEELKYVAAKDFADFPRDLTWLNAVAEASEVCVAVADSKLADVLHRQLLPHVARHVVYLGGALSWGSVARLLGMLAATLGRWDEAAAHFETALAANRRLGARPWVAYTQHAYGSMLWERRSPEDQESARYLVEQARFTAETLGMQPLAARAATLLERIGSGVRKKVIEPPLGHGAATPESSLFCREGDFWTIAYQGRVVRLRSSKGLQFLERLLHEPGREFHALDLVVDSNLQNPAIGELQAQARAALNSDAGELLDATAKLAYRERLAELREELAEAESANDLGRSARLRDEMEAIMAQLSAAVGLGGRDRRAGAAAERARMAVTKRIHDVLKKLQTEHPALANHLSGRIKTGYFCTYLPDPDRPVLWKFAHE